MLKTLLDKILIKNFDGIVIKLNCNKFEHHNFVFYN